MYERPLRELCLFAGAGGSLLGSMLLGWEPVRFVEHDAYCQRVLAARFPNVPCHSDVRDFHPVPGSCDIVTGGFPCTPHSQAGKRRGGLDDRDMWPDTIRILRESGAPLGYFENVPGLLTSRDAHGRSMFGGVLGDLAEAGFDVEWCVLGADDVGAPHRRKRLWILAYRKGDGRQQGWPESTRQLGRPDVAECGSPWWCDPADVGDAAFRDGLDVPGVRQGLEQEPGRGIVGYPSSARGRDEWLLEPRVGRVAHGVAQRVDRLRALGNGQVPQCMAAAFCLLADAAGLL